MFIRNHTLGAPSLFQWNPSSLRWRYVGDGREYPPNFDIEGPGDAGIVARTPPAPDPIPAPSAPAPSRFVPVSPGNAPAYGAPGTGSYTWDDTRRQWLYQGRYYPPGAEMEGPGDSGVIFIFPMAPTLPKPPPAPARAVAPSPAPAPSFTGPVYSAPVAVLPSPVVSSQPTPAPAPAPAPVAAPVSTPAQASAPASYFNPSPAPSPLLDQSMPDEYLFTGGAYPLFDARGDQIEKPASNSWLWLALAAAAALYS